jgi:hypothetical protein
MKVDESRETTLTWLMNVEDPGQINPGSHGARAVPEGLQSLIETSVRAAIGQ